VTQSIRVRTSDGRDLGTVDLTGTSGQLMRVAVEDLRDRGIAIGTIDPTYFVLREENQGDQLGAYVSRTTGDNLAFVPTTSTRILWVMNATNGANYACAAATPLILLDWSFNHSRYSTAQRLTPANNTVPDFAVVDGDMTSVIAGLDLLNQAWSVGGVKYAEIRWIGDASTAEINAGLGLNTNTPSIGYHIGNSFIVNPAYANVTRMTTSVEEALEVFLTYDDLCGKNTVLSLFQLGFSGTELSPAGRDLVRFGVLMRNLK
jgi:hypothetical protein